MGIRHGGWLCGRVCSGEGTAHATIAARCCGSDDRDRLAGGRSTARRLRGPREPLCTRRRDGTRGGGADGMLAVNVDGLLVRVAHAATPGTPRRSRPCRPRPACGDGSGGVTVYVPIIVIGAERSLVGSEPVQRTGDVPECIGESTRGSGYKPSALAFVASLRLPYHGT